MRYTVAVEKGRESGYLAFCPVLRGCVAQGKTKVETLRNLKMTIVDYIECLMEDGITVPREMGKGIIDEDASIQITQFVV